MKKNLLLFSLLFIPCLVSAQFSIVSTDPPNNAKNVPLTATISITFSEAIDTNAMNSDEAWFSNIDSMISYGYSADQKTAFGTYKLQPNTVYFYAFLSVKAKSGAMITTPSVYYFTTGADFPSTSVSGTLSAGTTGVTLENAVVGLMTMSIEDYQGEGPPPFAGWTNVNNNGTFTIPYIANGTYWPLAVKDVDANGMVRPEEGVDVMAFGDSVVVNNASVANVDLTFFTMAPKLFSDAIPIADSLDEDLPADKVLKRVSGWNVDTLGKGDSWEFSYTTNGNTIGYSIHVSPFLSKIDSVDDPGYLDWLKMMRPLASINTAASSAVVVANAENAGGKEVRLQQHDSTFQFHIEMSLADQNMSQYGHLVPNQNLFYWGVSYVWGYETVDQWVDIAGMRFLCDFTTGAVINSSVLSVPSDRSVPSTFELFQNFPNPFNPSTTIRFALRTSEFASLRVFDVLGKEVAVLADEQMDAGEHTVTFNAKNLPSGVYFYQLRAGNLTATKKLVLMK